MTVKFLEWYELDSLRTVVINGSIVVSWMVGGWTNERKNVKHWLRDDWRENQSNLNILYLQI